MHLFLKSGYGATHYLHGGLNVHGKIQQNIREGKLPVDGLFPQEGLEQLIFFSDMKSIEKEGDVIRFKESFKDFPIFERSYPNARFILNTRPKRTGSIQG